jgi:conjugal transfer pilus assembly protein TraL
MAEEVSIPSRIDDPFHFLFWTLDEATPFGLGVVGGIAVGQPFYGVIAAYVLIKLYRKFRDGHQDGYLWHIIYWYGFSFKKLRTMPNPFIRRFYP